MRTEPYNSMTPSENDNLSKLVLHKWQSNRTIWHSSQWSLCLLCIIICTQRFFNRDFKSNFFIKLSLNFADYQQKAYLSLLVLTLPVSSLLVLISPDSNILVLTLPNSSLLV